MKTYNYLIDDLGIADLTSTLRSKHWWWWMKDALARVANTAPWTVEGSCDSVTAAMDGADRWTTAFDDTKLVYANPGSAHSWIVLKSPAVIGDSYKYILIDFNRAGFWDTMDINISNAAYTGGSTTAAPTTVGDVYFYDNYGCGANGLSGTCHGAVATDGTFWLGYAQTASGKFQNIFALQTVTDTVTGDTETVVSYAEHGFAGISITPLDDIYLMVPGFGAILTSGTIEPHRYDSGYGILRSTMSKDFAENAYIRWPLVIWYTDAGLGGQAIKGTMEDTFIPIGSLAQGDTSGTGGSTQYIVVGAMLLPGNMAPTL